MPEEKVNRRLAAILAADVVGYGRLMEIDERATLGAIRARRTDVLDPLVSKHHGRIFKMTGDGVLVEFASAVNAIECAAELQQAFGAANADVPEDRRIVFRIGIHVGDVLVEAGDLFGDGVNIASRLEALAPPGGILLSAAARDHVGSRSSVAFQDAGDQALKNISLPIRTLPGRGHGAGCVRHDARLEKPTARSFLQQHVGRFEQEYFADGITEDIITELSRFTSLGDRPQHVLPVSRQVARHWPDWQAARRAIRRRGQRAPA
jgi:class 3 adenylate cyclase